MLLTLLFVLDAMGSKIFNFNVGVLGHVDSGKTSLAHALSTTASTAAFDKHPQSRERGITLDLGFSSFLLPINDQIATKLQLNADANREQMQMTLVDCPGHASLIRTVIGGAHIIDLVLLVIDANKGVQTQTAECLLLADIIRPSHMIVVLNKVDLLDNVEGQKHLQKLEKKLRKTLESTSFGAAPFVRVSACPGGSECIGQGKHNASGLQQLQNTLVEMMYPPARNATGPLLMAADHCFAIKGVGTVVTGTVIQGTVKVGDTVEIAALKESRKVKSLQMFRKPVQNAMQGDRVALNLTQFESSQFERGLVCSPGSVHLIYAAIVSVHRIAYYKQSLCSKTRFHISIGHETVMGRCVFFANETDEFSYEPEYSHVEQVDAKKNDELSAHHYVALLEFDTAVLCPENSLYIASRLDADVHTTSCRLAFHGKMHQAFINKNYKDELGKLKVYKCKERQGNVERLMDERTVIANTLFSKQSALDAFIGLKVSLTTGEQGRIDSGFGQSGKVKLYFPGGLKEETIEMLKNVGGKRKKNEAAGDSNGVSTEKIHANVAFKRYIFDPQKKMIQ